MHALRSFALVAGVGLTIITLSVCGGAGAGDLEGDATDPMTVFDQAIARFEQAPLAHLPTPFEEMPTLAAELGGPRLFVKRDDQTGLALGGNKARKLDFILADAVAKGSDSVVTWAGVQSNWARMTVGGSHTGGGMDLPLGAVAYANGFREMLEQARDAGVAITHVVHASGSGSTQAGLVVGAKMLAPEVRIIGISTGGSKAAGETNVLAIAEETVEAMGLDVEIGPDDVVVHDEYFGEGYGILNQGVVEAIALTARTEGILLDPVYTGKAMTGLLDLVRSGTFSETDAVVFLHTGGTPALFPYREGLLEDLPAPADE